MPNVAGKETTDGFRVESFVQKCLGLGTGTSGRTSASGGKAPSSNLRTYIKELLYPQASYFKAGLKK